MTADEFVKLKKGDPVRYQMEDGSKVECRVQSIHGTKEFRAMFLSATTFASLFFVNTREAHRVERLGQQKTALAGGEEMDLFAS